MEKLCEFGEIMVTEGGGALVALILACIIIAIDIYIYERYMYNKATCMSIAIPSTTYIYIMYIYNLLFYLYINALHS